MLIACSQCHHENPLAENAAVTQATCTSCGAILLVPAVTEPAPAAELPTVAVTIPPESANASEALTVDSEPPPSTEGATPSSEPVVDRASYSFLAPAQAADELGRLGAYRVLKVLGQGGMGIVFVGEDIRLGRKVALKAMLPELATRPAARERFLREARTAAAIEHEHIVAIYQVDEDRGVPFIAMPLLRGNSLDDWLRKQPPGPLSLPLMLNLGRQVAQGLAAAHEHGLIHRDIKPANIFLQSVGKGSDSRPSFSLLFNSDDDPAANCRVKILDFGLARSITGEQNLTLSGAIVGTPAYMAPEQARSGSTVDGRADLFSLGVVLYRLATGVMPFKGDDLMSTLMAVAMDQPTAPAVVNPALPAAFSDLVMRLLAKDPNQRPGSAAEVVKAIEALEATPATVLVRMPIADEPLMAQLAPEEFQPEDEEELNPGRHRHADLDENGDGDESALRAPKKEDTTLSMASMIVGIASAVVGVFAACCCGALRSSRGDHRRGGRHRPRCEGSFARRPKLRGHRHHLRCGGNTDCAGGARPDALGRRYQLLRRGDQIGLYLPLFQETLALMKAKVGLCPGETVEAS